MSRHRFFNLTLSLLLPVLPALSTALGTEADFDSDQPDVVIVRSDQNEVTRRIRGKIVRWEGSALTIAAGSRERQIDNDRIVDVETEWSKVATQARQQMAAGAFARAIVRLRQAMETEQRPWVKTMLRAELIRALLATDQPAAACNQFLIVLRDDPNTRFLGIAPMVWTDGVREPTLIVRARDWLTSEVPMVRLLGASYLVGTAQQEAALQLLEPLSRDLDQRIAGLASAQIWRTQQNVDIRLIEQWRDQLSAMPKELRPGPNHVLAGHFEAASQFDEAITTWMRLPILHDDRPDLAAAALYRVARLMHNTASEESADIVHQELTRRFPDSVWTQRADRLK